jgi:hypothetical protein
MAKTKKITIDPKVGETWQVRGGTEVVIAERDTWGPDPSVIFTCIDPLGNPRRFGSSLWGFEQSGYKKVSEPK